MFRSILGRLATYGVVLGVNALPLLAAVWSDAVALPSTPAIVTAELDEVEGEADVVTARFLPIPQFEGTDDAAEPAEVLTTDAEPPTDAPPTRVVGDGGSSGAGGDPVAVAGSGPAAGAGTGAGVDPGDGKASKGTRPKGARKSGRTKVCDTPHPNIHAGRDGIVEIDRSLVDEYTRNLDAFMKLGFSRPYDEEGLEGWYISGFSCTSPVAKAGFKRGDVLLTVNGKKTRSWVGVFMLYQRLKNKDDFEIELVRKGEPLTLKFRVVG